MMPRARIAVALLGLFLLGVRPAFSKNSGDGPEYPTATPTATPPATPFPLATPVLFDGSENLEATTTPVLEDGSASMEPSAQPPILYGEDTPQVVSGAESGQLRNYGQQVGQDWLKHNLGLDIQSMRLVWDPVTWRFIPAGELEAREEARAGYSDGTVSPGPAAAASSGDYITMQVVQNSDLSHLTQGVRDVPYNVEVKGAFRPLRSMSAINTSLKIPLSPYDTWRADASMPMDWNPWWWRDLGLGRNLDLHSGINSRLGFNQVETGMRTKWTPGFWGPWDLDYAWDLHYGEGSGESSNWLKISKEF
jgi:hypothetical protein